MIDGAKMDNYFWGDQHTIVDFAPEQIATAITLDLKVQYAAWGHTTPLYQANMVIYKGCD